MENVLPPSRHRLVRSAPIPLVDLYQVAKSVLQLQMLVAFGLRLAKPAELLAGCDLEHHHPEFSFFFCKAKARWSNGKTQTRVVTNKAFSDL